MTARPGPAKNRSDETHVLTPRLAAKKTRPGPAKNRSTTNHRRDPRFAHSPPEPNLETSPAPREAGARCGACGAELPSGPGVRGRKWCDECSDGHGQFRSRDRRKVRRRCSSCARLLLAEACTQKPTCDRCRAVPRSCSECSELVEGSRVVCSPTCAERRRRRLRPEIEAEKQRRKRVHRRARQKAGLCDSD